MSNTKEKNLLNNGNTHFYCVVNKQIIKTSSKYCHEKKKIFKIKT